MLRQILFPQWTWRLPQARGQVALTFDDGPHPDSTPKLLTALRALDITSTMFFLGEQCATHVDLTRTSAGAGHAIGVHGYAHESFLWQTGGWQADNIRRCAAVYEESGIPFSSLFRPPHGHFNLATSGVLRQLGYRGVMWSQMPRDWVEQPAVALESRLLTDLHDGSIIVLHDRPRTIDNVIACLPALAAEVRRRGWQFIPLTLP